MSNFFEDFLKIIILIIQYKYFWYIVGIICAIIIIMAIASAISKSNFSNNEEILKHLIKPKVHPYLKK
jgi:uncharacterized protein YggT (Ycf19 family)